MIKNMCSAAAFLALSITAMTLPTSASEMPPEQAEIPCRDADTLYFGLSADIGRLDPAFVLDLETCTVISAIYEGLLRPGPGSIYVMPDLAESYEVSDDALTYTFHLKKGVRFHDGTPFNAQAVKYNYDRQLPGRASRDMYFAPEVFQSVKNIEIIDDFTVRFNLTEPNAGFIYNMARLTAAPICSPSALKKHGNDISDNPVGTGPYRFVSKDASGSVTLARNDDYHGETPKVKTIVFSVYRENLARFLQLIRGQLDIISGIDLSILRPVRESGNSLIISESRNTNYIAFNMREGAATSDLKIRRAIRAALNIPELVQKRFGPNLTAVANTYLPESRFVNPSLTYHVFNPVQAKKTFEKHNLHRIRILTSTEPRFFNTAGGAVLTEGIVEQFESLGLEVEVEALDRMSMAKRISETDWDICITGWNSETGGALNLLWPVYTDNTMFNIGAWHNERFNEIIDLALRTKERAERIALYTQAEAVMTEELPIIPISHAKSILATGKYITGDFLHDFARVDIPAVQKSQCKLENKVTQLRSDVQRNIRDRQSK